MRIKALLGGVGFAALLLLGSVPAQAQYYGGGDCRDRIVRAERHLDRAIERHGHHSDRAREARRDLDDVRDRCRRYRERDRDHYRDHYRDRHDRRY